MSNALAVAAVTSTIRFVLEEALGGSQPGPVGGANVTTFRPAQLSNADTVGQNARGINVFLYHVTPNHAWNLTDLPTRSADGSLARRPIAALDLHYLITCYGDDSSLDAQRLLGRGVLALAVKPVLTNSLVSAAMSQYDGDVETAFLADADLADQVELVKLSPTPMSTEEMSKVWTAFSTPYLLSLTYTATVVLLEADVTPRVVLPVRERGITVSAVGPPRLVAVDADPPHGPVLAGSILVLTGSSLRGPVTSVQIGGVAIDAGDSATAQRLAVTVPVSVKAGVHGVQVVHLTPPGPPGGPPARVVATSNAVPILVRPTISSPAVAGGNLTFDVTPGIFARQRAIVTLRRLSGGDTGDPDEMAFALTRVVDDVPPQTTVTLAADDIPDGTWLIRIEVDGVESLPSLVGETYGAPAVTLP
jgi:hypothetical protein